MVDPELLDVMDDSKVLLKYKEYASICIQRDQRAQPLIDIVTNVSMGERGNHSLLDCVLGVLDAMLFPLTHSWEEILKIAEEGREENMEKLRNNMEPELYARLEKNIAFMKALTLPKVEPRGLKDSLEARNVELNLRRCIRGATPPLVAPGDEPIKAGPYLEGDELVEYILQMFKVNQDLQRVIRGMFNVE